ncbi:hypothetical protein [Mesorhizobium sp. LSHC414A00]|uniref:NACHT domain-containing protein n=1 Tax=Mesorhizobium sp. LSHC414A00 TaxID=1287287 RepID=UPI0003CDFBB4|nr:hypothetical protein [Mesorhizobium sp. LSHC414A00]ESX66631.1 hypothetical protein X757_31230 [Mesorhizobium sp. LSHC414A00]
MIGAVPLIRRFTPISRHYQDADVDLENIWTILDRGKRLEWGSLRDAYRCVILADAGAGKTFELKAEAERLAARGRNAFFIRIEDIDEAFGAAFEVGKPEAFEAWLAGTGEAWFFLDSVDEVRLEAPRAFETAIRAFASRIHDARQRAHVYISSRPYAWRSRIDGALIEELLPYEPPVREATGDEAEPEVSAAKNDAKPGLELFRLAPLDPDDIRIFAGHRGVSDADALIEALERTDLFVIAQLPFDLEDILAVWGETGSLDSRLAVLERGLRRRLAPSAGRLVTLSLEKAVEGARRIAIATTLTGEANIQMPGASGGGIDAVAVLHDWTIAEILELLGRGVFTDAIYKMVRFRHRESRELLAAQELAGALANPELHAKIEALLFREVYGEAVVVPRTRPLLPWLILFDERVRDRALALQPEIITEGGDPARLPIEVRKRILRDLVERIATGDSRGGDNSAIARIAQPDLTDETLALLGAYGDNDDVIFFLGRLVWQGAMAVAAERLSPVARDPDRGIYARIVSTRAVSTIGGADAGRELWSALNASGVVLPRRLLGELVDGAPPDLASVDLLLASLETVESHERFETTGLSQAIRSLIDRLPLTSDTAPERPLVRLIEGLADFLAREPHIQRRECKISEIFRWLMAPAMHAVERLIVSRSQACFDPAPLAVLSQAPALRHWGASEEHEHRTKLNKLVPRWTALNDALFWHTVAMVREAREDTDKPVDDDWTVSWMGHFWAFDEPSFSRTLGWTRTRDLADDRSLALSRTFRTYAQNRRPRSWRRLLWRSVGGDPILESKLKTLMRPMASPERRRWRANERKWAQRRRRRDENEAAGRAALVARLKANPDLVREPAGLEPGQMSWDQAHLLQSVEGDGMRISRGAGSKWQMLIPEFGEAVAVAFRDGAQLHWRAYRPTLRSENGGSNSIPYALIFAMAGLEIESGDDGRGLTQLGNDDALHALHYVFSELNGFPHWLEPLYRAHPEAGFDLIWGETRWELANSGAKPMHYMLHDLVYHAPWLHAALAPSIHDWLSEHGAANGDCLRHGCTIMISGGLSTASLAALARRRVEDATTPANQFASWLAMWVDCAPDAAIPVLDAHLESLSSPDDARFAEEFVVSLVGGSYQSGLSTSAWKSPQFLKALYVLMHQHIRSREDLDRANGRVYSPTTRNDAQDARNSLFNLLSAIPGEATYREILTLAEDHPEPSYRVHMRRRAYARAVEDSDREWSLTDALILSGQMRRKAAN